MSAKNISAKNKTANLLRKRKITDQPLEDELILREHVVKQEPQDAKVSETSAEQTFSEVYEKSVEATPAAEFAEPALFAQVGEIGGTATGGGGIGAGATGAAGAAGAAAAASGVVAAAGAGSAALAGMGAGIGSSGIAALGAGAAVVAAAAGAGTAAAMNNVKVIFVGGIAVPDHGLTVELLKADGTTKIGEATFNEKGEVTIQAGDYLGVVVGRILDKDDGYDYFDEVAGPKDLSANLFTVGEIVQANSTITLNINVLTTIAYLKALLAVDPGKALDSATVNSVNTAVAKAFGLVDLQKTTVVATNSNDYDPTSINDGEKYGQILAALSRLDDSNGGSTQKTIDDLVGNSLAGGNLPITDLKSTTPPVLDNNVQQVLNNVSTQLPSTTVSDIKFQGDTDLTTAQSSQTITAKLSQALTSHESVWGSFDGGATWFNLSNVSGAVSGTNISWNIALYKNDSLQFRVVDDRGNKGPLASADYVFTGTVPSVKISGVHISDDTGTSATDFITKTTSQTLTATLSTALTTGQVLKGSVDGGATWTDISAITGAVSGTTIQWSTSLASGTNNIVFKVVDGSGNSGAPLVQEYELDASIPQAPTVSPLAVNKLLPTITGTSNLEYGETLTVEINGATYRVAPKSNGSWSLDLSTAKPTSGTLGTFTDGTYSVIAKVTDKAGNAVSDITSSELIIDTVAPTTPSSAPSGYKDDVGSVTSDSSTASTTDDTKPGIFVGVGLTDTPKLYVNGTLVAATYDPAYGTLTPDVALAQGTYSFTYTLTDAAGNESGQSGALNITIDTTAPTTTISGLDISDDTGTLDTDFITKTASQTVSATLSAALATGEELYGSVDNGATWVKITDKVSGTAVSWNTATLSGSSSIKLQVRDAAGNTGTAASQAYTLDTTAPTTTISGLDISDDTGTLDTDFITKTASQTVSATLSAALATGEELYGSVDNGATWIKITDKVSGTAVSWNNATLSGSSSIKLEVRDAAGNSGTAASQAYTLDTTAPDTPSAPTSYKDDVGSTQNTSSTAATTDDSRPGINVGTGLTDKPKLYVDGLEVAATYDSSSGTLTPNSPLSEGPHEIKYSLIDTAGNESGLSGALSLTVEVPPAVSTIAITSATGASNGYLNTGDTVTVTATMTKSVTVSGTPRIALNIGGTTVYANYSSGTGTDTLTFTYTITNENDSNGISIAANALSLNGGSITSGSDTVTITHAAVADNSSYKVDNLAPDPSLQSVTYQVQAFNDPSWATQPQKDPQLACISPDGSYVMVWTAKGSSGYYIASQRFDSDGNAVGSKTSVSGPPSGHDLRGPHVAAVGTNGDYVVVWGYNAGASNPADWDAYVQKFDSTGTAIGSPQKLGSFTGTGSNITTNYEVTALGSDGSYAVAWSEATNTGMFDVYVQRFNASNQLNGSAIVFNGIYQTSYSDNYDNDVSIVPVGTAGAFAVGWAGGGDTCVFSQFVDSTGTKVGPMYQSSTRTDVLAPVYSGSFPEIFDLDSSTYGMIWTGYGSESIKIQLFNSSDGSTKGSLISWVPGSQYAYPAYQDADLAVLNNGHFIVATPGLQTSTTSAIYVQEFDSNGTKVGNTNVIEASDNANGLSRHVKIAALSDGGYAVAWDGTDSGGDSSIYIQQFDSNSSSAGYDQVKLEATGVTNGQDQFPAIKALAGGGYAVAWYGQDQQSPTDSNDTSVYTQRFSASGKTSTMVTSFDHSTVTAVKVQSSELGKAYLVSSSLLVSSESDITAANVDLWNDVQISTANQLTDMSLSGLAAGTYKLYSVDLAGNLGLFNTNVLLV